MLVEAHHIETRNQVGNRYVAEKWWYLVLKLQIRCNKLGGSVWYVSGAMLLVFGSWRWSWLERGILVRLP